MSKNPFASVIASAAETEDQTKAVSAERRVIPAGMAMARLIEYVELGPQPQSFNGQPKPDCEEVRVAFELFGGNGKYSYTNADGETVNDVISWRGAKRLNPKSQFFKMMKKMVYGRDGITHMAQMLGEAFLLEVKHRTSEKDGKETVYANIFVDSECNILAPVQNDVLTGETKALPVPEPTRQFRCFIWKSPTPECWDSIFIDGSRTVKDGDKEVEKSNNWMQEMLLSSPAFAGSALEAMLAQKSAADGGLPPIDDSAAIGQPLAAVSDDEIPF